MFTINSTTDIAAPLAAVRAAISTEAGYRAWLAEDTEVDGTRVIFRFAQPNETRSVTFRIDRRDVRSVVMTCVAHENNPDWLGTVLAIELGATAAGTRVSLSHSGYPAKNEVYERCNDAWPYFLRSLTAYLTTGAGQPYPKAS